MKSSDPHITIWQRLGKLPRIGCLRGWRLIFSYICILQKVYKMVGRFRRGVEELSKGRMKGGEGEKAKRNTTSKVHVWDKVSWRREWNSRFSSRITYEVREILAKKIVGMCIHRNERSCVWPQPKLFVYAYRWIFLRARTSWQIWYVV